MTLHQSVLSVSHRLSRSERSTLTADLLEELSETSEPSARAELVARIVEANLRIAHAVAARYRGRGVPLEDLEQAACEGLVKAVQRFSAEHERDLLSYAVPTIRGEVLRYFRDASWNLRPPRRIQELQWQLNHAADRLQMTLGREATPAEICAEVGIERSEYDEAMLAFGCFQPPSIDQPTAGTDDLTLADSLSSRADEQSAVTARVVLAPAVRRLSERDRRVLYLRFYEDRTQSEIGLQFGVPQMQVSRWLSRIMRDLRTQIGPVDGADDALSMSTRSVA